jgi:hypothetical protein
MKRILPVLTLLCAAALAMPAMANAATNTKKPGTAVSASVTHNQKSATHHQVTASHHASARSPHHSKKQSDKG